jgi:segregation and condensation protein B
MAEDEDPGEKNKNIVEAALFSAGRPLTIQEIVEATGLATGVVTRALKKLTRKFKGEGTAIEIAKVGPKFIMQVKTEYTDAALHFAPSEIPRKLLKTLALIAYHQPIKQSELKTMVGDRVYEHVRELRERGMVVARKAPPTRILITSKRFPEYFGIASATRAGIKKWIAEKVGIKVKKGKIPIKDFEDIEEDLAHEAAKAEGDRSEE